MNAIPMLSLAVAATLAVTAGAQALDTASLTEIGRADVVSPDGNRIGEVEDALIDASGTPVAIAVEIRERFLNLGNDDEVIFALDTLDFQNGDYVTDLTADQIKALPRHHD